MAGYYQAGTMLRAEWEELQKGTQAQLRTSYEEYLKRLGVNSEAEAIAQRAKEEAEGKSFGGQAVPLGVFGTSTRADRKISDEEEAANQAGQLANDSYAAKQIQALTGGRITGREPVYIFGTPEHNKYMQDQMGGGRAPVAPDAYLDAQAFNARFIAYSRLGATEPTSTVYDAATDSWIKVPNPFFNAKVLEPKVGMGTAWSALNQAMWATVQPGVGRTAATDAAEYNIEAFFSSTVGGNPVGQRFFMRTPGDMVGGGGGTATKTVVSTTKDPNGNTITKYSDGYSTSTDSNGAVTELTAGTSGGSFDQNIAAGKKAERVSAYNTLYEEFNKYGLGMLVSDIKNYLIDNSFDPSEFAIKLQNTAAYQNRFSANKDRIKAGLGALSPAQYITLEDQYQNVMRNYGLPSTYWKQTVDPVTGVTSQQGFNQLIANDVDSIELEDRIMTAQQRVVNANPEVLRALKEFYPDIQNGDILAYVLDPANAKDVIKRKVTAAEIGGAQMGAGLTATKVRAEELQKAGITKQRYQEDAATIAEDTMRGGQLSAIYKQDPYTQQTAEASVLNLPGSAEAKRQTKKLTSLESAAFSGRSGTGAIARDRAGVI
jgi:hypothetical protein